MAITMADFIEKRGAGQTPDPNEVALGANELARLARINALDPRQSAYSGLGIQRAQEFASELPSAADLGLVVEQNKQLQAAGGRGYAGNVHNMQGDQTPFEQLTANIAASQAQGVRSAPVGITRGIGGVYGEGASSPGGFSGETLGDFGQEAFADAAKGAGVKGAAGFGLGAALGAPLGMAAKFGLTSILTPLSVLLGMGKMAYGGALDMAHSQMSQDIGMADVGGYSGEGKSSPSGVGEAVSPGQASSSLGLGIGDVAGLGGRYGGALTGASPSERAQAALENMSLFDRAVAAAKAVARGPEGGWLSSTDTVDFGGLSLHSKLAEQAAKNPMIGKTVLGFNPTFGGGGGRGSSDGVGSTGGGRAASDAATAGQNDASGLGGGGYGGGSSGGGK